MSRLQNSCTFIGRLTSDPEKRDVGETTCASFSIAIDRPPKRNDQGEILRDDNGYAICDTDFPRITCWGKLAEQAVSNLSKGRLIAVSCEVRTSSREREGGGRDYFTDFRADSFQYLDSPRGGNGGGQGETKQSEPAAATSGPVSDDEF